MKTKRGILGLFLALCVVWSMLPLGAFAADADEGAKHISTAAALQTIQNDLGGTYVLDNDIDLSSIENWTPIGASETPFTGTFDGQGHQITGLTVDSDSNDQGLFGYVGSGGTVKNVTVSGTVSGRGSNISVGGVVGKNSGTIENCHNTVAVSGSGTGGSGDSIFVGGVVGYNSSGTITNCSNTSTVSGDGSKGDNIYVGGVVGYNSKGTVTNCSNTGTVSGNGSVNGFYGDSISVGGVVGENSGIGTVENCYNTGTVSSDNSAADIGGVVGSMLYGDPKGTVKNCYNAGMVKGSAYNAGGVVGFTYNQNSTIENCYNTGTVNGSSYVGGVVGFAKSEPVIPINSITNCYYLTGTAAKGIGGSSSSIENSPQPLTEEKFANKENFIGWDFASTWEMSELLGRPILRSNREGGSGTLASPYEIPDLATLEYYRAKINADTEGTTYRGASYVLTDDIDMSGKYGEDKGEGGAGVSWTPIGSFSNAFTGTFDGQGHSIRGLYIVNTSSPFSTHYPGLFGYVGEGTVKNLTISGNVSGASMDSVGGVVGQNNGGTIENCKFEGSIRGGNYGGTVGGVVGGNANGTVKNCSNTGTVSGTDTSAGGVVGENSGIGTVENCSNTGEVSGDDNPAGGVVGENSGTVENCSNTGKVSGTGGMQAPVGGVVGQNDNGTVKNCSNTGKVSGTGGIQAPVGGVVGRSYGGSTVTNCSNAGNVSSDEDSVGGVVGYNGSSTVENCSNTGMVSGSNNAGGVVGENKENGTVENCYNTGTVSGKGSVGGVVGENDGISTVANCYYEQGKAAFGIGGPTASNTGAESKTSAQFASGEVAWLLKDGQTPDGDTNVKPLVWGQKIGQDDDLVLTAFNPDAPQVYRVTFQTEENIPDVPDVPDQYVNKNCTVTEPDIPGKEDSTLGWYSDSEYTKRWDFENDTVRQDMTLHAKWLSKDAGVSSVTVSGTKAEPGENNTFTVTLPAGSSLPANANEITIIPVTGATVSEPTSTNGGATWTFTVTAEDGTKADYTIQITVEQPEPEPDPEPETPVTPPAPPSGGGSSNPTYRPDIGKTENGEVDVSTTRPHAGDTVTVTPKPDDGYDVQTVTVTDEDGSTVTVTPNEDGSFTFIQPEGEVTIDVAFTPHVSSSIQLQDGSAVEIASPDDVIEIPQSSTFTVTFKSEKPLSDFAFLAGNGKAIATDTVAAWNPETREGTYTLYGLGAPGTAHDTTGIYVNGVKLFSMQVVPRPLTSDTTVDFAMSVGQTYQFWVKPDDPDANYTFNTANGDMLQTAIVKDAYPDEQGRYLCRLTVTGRGDTVGVYCSIDGNTYKLFTVDCR